MKRYLLMLTGLVCGLFLCGCNEGGNSSNAPDNAAVSFTVQWPDETAGDNTGKTEEALTALLSDDCAGRGVATVSIRVNNSAGATLSTGTFPCSAKTGTVSGIPPGSGYTVIVSGLNASGTATHRGQKTGVTLNSGSNNIGIIQVTRINNTNPLAAITSPLGGATFQPGSAVTFSGTGTDTEDEPLTGTYLVWTSSRDGQIGVGKTFTTTSLSTGIHTISLMVTDRDGATGSKSITITVQPAMANKAPTSTITSPANGGTYQYDVAVTFSGSGTDPEDGQLSGVDLVWASSINGQIGTGTSFSSFLATGAHTITLTATDRDGAIGSTSINITIATNATNNPPTADAGPDQSVVSGNSVQLNGSGSLDTDGTITGYQWLELSGPAVTLSSPSSARPTFTAPSVAVSNQIIFELTVTDNKGATDTDRATITINASAPATFTNTVGMTFAKINPGTFMMGSPADEPGRDSDETRHQVTLTQGFYMQTTEVTQGQWVEVMGNNPSYFKSGDNYPVEIVSWNDTQTFIANMNLRGDGIYSLPTEAQWEYAARAGTTTPFAFGDCLSTSQANYDGNYPLTGCSTGTYRKNTIAVGSLSKNDWGLYDMHGNVYEWCADWHGSYPASSVNDPTGPSSGGSRVLRGGSWGDGARYCRSASRYGSTPDNRGNGIGFRLVLLPGQ